jgi:hypothetical protein
MFDMDYSPNWYERRWLTPRVTPPRGRVSRALARLKDGALRGVDAGNVASWHFPPL